MSSTMTKIGIFAGGVLVGVAATYFAVKTKYEQLAEKEIKEMREFYKDKSEKEIEIIEQNAVQRHEHEKAMVEAEEQAAKEEEFQKVHEEELEEYREIVKQYNNPEYADALVRKRELQIKEAEKEEENMTEEFAQPYYIIKPEQYGDNDFEPVTLTWYADGVLADEYDNVIDEDEIEERIGMEALVNIGAYEDGLIHVRNDYLEIDYEIQEDPRNYMDIYSV